MELINRARLSKRPLQRTCHTLRLGLLCRLTTLHSHCFPIAGFLKLAACISPYASLSQKCAPSSSCTAVSRAWRDCQLARPQSTFCPPRSDHGCCCIESKGRIYICLYLDNWHRAAMERWKKPQLSEYSDSSCTFKSWQTWKLGNGKLWGIDITS